MKYISFAVFLYCFINFTHVVVDVVIVLAKSFCTVEIF